jgi:hypothetical protein
MMQENNDNDNDNNNNEKRPSSTWHAPQKKKNIHTHNRNNNSTKRTPPSSTHQDQPRLLPLIPLLHTRSRIQILQHDLIIGFEALHLHGHCCNWRHRERGIYSIIVVEIIDTCVRASVDDETCGGRGFLFRMAGGFFSVCGVCRPMRDIIPTYLHPFLS